ncbi:MAG: RimK family protein [Luteibaculum sp.]
MRKILVVGNPKQWPLKLDQCDIISSREYLTNPAWSQVKQARVFNLSTEYRYQTKGYYVSLMAEARGHRPIPNVKNIQDLNTTGMVKNVSDNLDDIIQRSFKSLKSKDFVLSIYFGRNLARQYDKVSHELHRVFSSPFMRAKFSHNGKKWVLQSLKTIPFKEIPESHMDFVWESATAYFQKTRYEKQKESTFQFELAILVNEQEKAPPSNKKALQKFVDAAEKLGFYVELISKNDYARLLEFDALFIRETTAVNHYTYRFARRAQQDGLAVIDDPDSILKCANKVYLAELLKLHKIPTPKTIVVHQDNKDKVLKELNLPCVLKSPDSSFSQGVSKAKTEEEYREKITQLLSQSELVIAQEYLPSDFDWRIGVLENEIIYACKYFMAKGHWQVYNWDSKIKKEVEGGFECVPIEEIPDEVRKIALRSTQVIGRGLYGVDIKVSKGKAVIIEVNDNPNIDHGIEDVIAGNGLYTRIITSIKNRIQDQIKP